MVFYKKLYSPRILFEFNTCYFLPSIPMLILQVVFDHRMDQRFGVGVAHRFRNTLALGGSTIVLASFPFWPECRAALLGCGALMGMLSGISFGSSHQLVPFFSARCSVALEIGFVASAPLILATTWFFGVTYKATWQGLFALYEVAAALSLVGLSSMLVLIASEEFHYNVTSKSYRKEPVDPAAAFGAVEGRRHSSINCRLAYHPHSPRTNGAGGHECSSPCGSPHGDRRKGGSSSPRGVGSGSPRGGGSASPKKNRTSSPGRCSSPRANRALNPSGGGHPLSPPMSPLSCVDRMSYGPGFRESFLDIEQAATRSPRRQSRRRSRGGHGHRTPSLLPVSTSPSVMVGEYLGLAEGGVDEHAVWPPAQAARLPPAGFQTEGGGIMYAAESSGYPSAAGYSPPDGYASPSGYGGMGRMMEGESWVPVQEHGGEVAEGKGIWDHGKEVGLEATFKGGDASDQARWGDAGLDNGARGGNRGKRGRQANSGSEDGDPAYEADTGEEGRGVDGRLESSSASSGESQSGLEDSGLSTDYSGLSTDCSGCESGSGSFQRGGVLFGGAGGRVVYTREVFRRELDPDGKGGDALTPIDEYAPSLMAVAMAGRLRVGPAELGTSLDDRNVGASQGGERVLGGANGGTTGNGQGFHIPQDLPSSNSSHLSPLASSLPSTPERVPLRGDSQILAPALPFRPSLPERAAGLTSAGMSLDAMCDGACELLLNAGGKPAVVARSDAASPLPPHPPPHRVNLTVANNVSDATQVSVGQQLGQQVGREFSPTAALASRGGNEALTNGDGSAPTSPVAGPGPASPPGAPGSPDHTHSPTALMHKKYLVIHVPPAGAPAGVTDVCDCGSSHVGSVCSNHEGSFHGSEWGGLGHGYEGGPVTDGGGGITVMGVPEEWRRAMGARRWAAGAHVLGEDPSLLKFLDVVHSVADGQPQPAPNFVLPENDLGPGWPAGTLGTQPLQPVHQVAPGALHHRVVAHHRHARRLLLHQGQAPVLQRCGGAYLRLRLLVLLGVHQHAGIQAGTLPCG
eukprot:jgi/Mesvir1/8624/Mv13047-RA.2